MNTEQQPAADLIDKPSEATESIAVPAEWENDFKSINDLLTTMESWKLMSIEKDGITKVTANRVAAKKLRIRIEELRKELGRVIMLRKSNVDAFADKLRVAVTAVEDALGVIEDAHKAKVKSEREEREAQAANILNERISQLEALGYIPADVAAVGKMTSPDFLQLLDARRRIFEAAERTKVRVAELLAIGPDDIREGSISMMSDAEFATYLTCHRVDCERRERERVEAEQAERDRVEKIERELEESQRRIAELEESQTVKPIVNSNGDTMPPQLGEVIQVPLTGGLMLPAGVEISQSGVTLLPPGYDVQAVADTVDISLDMRIDDSELYRIGNELDLSADAFRMFMHLGDSSIQAVFRIEKKTGVGTLIRINGLDVDRPF